MSAPVFWSDISLHACAISATDRLSVDVSPPPPARIFLSSGLFSMESPARLPTVLRKRRISGWKITMRAMAPTSISVPRMDDTIFSPSAEAMICMTSTMMIATKMLMAEEPRIQRKMK